MVVREFPHPRRASSPVSPGVLIVIGLVVLLLLGRTIAGYIIDYEWWREVGQLSTWTTSILYGTLPQIAAIVLLFAVFWVAHARGMKRAGTGLSEHPVYGRIATVFLLILSVIVGLATVDSWTIVRYAGARSLSAGSAGWRDPVFGHPLAFYFYELPFYSDLLGLLLALTFITALIYWVTDRVWRLHPQLTGKVDFQVNLTNAELLTAFESRFVRLLMAVFLIGIAARVFLSRFDMLFNDHRFLVGVDYVNDHFSLPLQWATIAACLVAAALILMRRVGLAAALIVVPVVQWIVPPLVSSLYVKPNEISLQRPYIQRHIEATREAFGLAARVTETQFPAKLEARIDPTRHKNLLENVRLWDWRAFHDIITQLQALRQYYVFNDTDVDRYIIDGELRQMMVTPRELDVHQLADARSNWINSHFIYTHGYGVVAAEANKITPSGTPVLFIQDAPPKINTASLTLTRPELYFGEKTHEPVFVRTDQPEFNYPSGSGNVHTTYEGRAGIPIHSLFLRLVAAIREGDANILLTGQFRPDSRMLIHRDVRDRLTTLAEFIQWDDDPYLVITKEGRLVWMCDGYTTSSQHPYSRAVRQEQFGAFNYIRNSVKATVDAYDGTVNLYIFDPADPIIRAWQAIFPALFKPESEMPADLRAHARYPEHLFLAQADIYRTYHMRDPESFYNKEDLWDFAKNVYGQGGRTEMLHPTYVVATLPGEDTSEFLLMEPFTPRSKDNLIGLMLARCDGPHLGEMVVLQLSKQALVYGPLQVEARIDSDQNISKDLSLWNQQGSSVLRGQMLVLPIEDTFLYVEPIYIQSSQSKMPQMKKVVVAMGNTIIYRDTYQQALAELGVQLQPVQEQTARVAAATQAPAAIQQAPPVPSASPGAPGDPRLNEVRTHLRRYRDLSAQGKWAEAGRELEAIEALVQK